MKRKQSSSDAKKELPPLSDSQLEIMTFVWGRKEVTVAEVWTEVASRRKVSRNTIQTLIVRLRDKGWLRERIDGSTYWYRAAKKQAGTQKQMVSRLLENAFEGSAEGLVMALLNSRQLSKDEAARIRKMIDESQKKE